MSNWHLLRKCSIYQSNSQATVEFVFWKGTQQYQDLILMWRKQATEMS